MPHRWRLPVRATFFSCWPCTGTFADGFGQSQWTMIQHCDGSRMDSIPALNSMTCSQASNAESQFLDRAPLTSRSSPMSQLVHCYACTNHVRTGYMLCSISPGCFVVQPCTLWRAALHSLSCSPRLWGAPAQRLVLHQQLHTHTLFLKPIRPRPPW